MRAHPGVVTCNNAITPPTQRTRRHGNNESPKDTGTQYQRLLPILVAVIVSLAAFPGAVGRVARDAGRGPDHVVARLAVGLRPLVVGLAGLVRLQEGGRLLGGLGGGRVDGGGGSRGAGPLGLVGLARAGSLIVRVLVPADFLLGRCGWTQGLLA